MHHDTEEEAYRARVNTPTRAELWRQTSEKMATLTHGLPVVFSIVADFEDAPVTTSST